ncbi:mandelate racemase/muconate lactonizing enzyme family protein [Ornithinimicrobium sp. Y1847]|uniref:mandelate racemase/muconate lactonizing enzyme family protein n=1 Tax=Ornithinimicrobium sp. Y1847 TaxID=3405419 RepID=UPI003B6813AA
MRITGLSATSIRLPLKQPLAFSTRAVRHRDYTVVRVETEASHGWGFNYAGTGGGGVVVAAVDELLRDVVVGEDSWDVERLWAAMYQKVLLHGRVGSVMRALSAIDIALWDANARSVGLPLWKLLGGHAQTVPAYASGGYYFEGKDASGLADEMESYVQAGFRAVKMKVGRGDLRSEEARIAAVRERVGPDVLVMLDANNAWADVVTAQRMMAMFEKYDPYWIEEPFSPDDKRSHAALAARTSVPVATGEIEAGRWAHLELLGQGSAQILQTDAAVCGGITEYRRISSLAAAHGVRMAPHWFHDLHAHLVAGDANGMWVEYFPDSSVLNFRDLVSHQLDVQDGQVRMSDRPGLGFEIEGP